MNQNIGAPGVPCVSAGERVLVGQKIADAGGFVSVPVLSSVSGTVKSVAAKECHNGDTALAVTVSNDGLYEKIQGFGEYRDYKELTKEQIIEIIKDAGIVGMGGAGFPTHVKLAVKPGTKIDYVICNGAECEPYITCDYRLMLEAPEKAVLGMKMVLSLFDGAKGIFGIESNKPDGIARVSEACRGEENISVVPLKRKYPQGGERVMITALTKRRINSKMLPADAGCVVLNFSTLTAIAEAVAYNKPLIHRIVTVTGDAINEPSNLDVLLGTNVEELVEAAGGLKYDPEKIIFGGPMMGAAVYSLDVPVNKVTSCVLLLKNNMAVPEAHECIRCGRCLQVCPEHLMPIKLKNTADANDYAEFEKLNGLECIGCGCCTYICPAKRRLSQSITAAKQFVIAEKKKAANKK
jgi:electron transport complex protein RnfC